MTQDNDQPGSSFDDLPLVDIPRLLLHRDDLIRALQDETDPAARADLAAELQAVSDQIDRATEAAEADPDDAHQFMAMAGHARTTGETPPAYLIDEEDGEERSRFDAFAGSGSNWPSAPVLAVVGVSLVILAALLWLGGSDDPESPDVSVAPAGPGTSQAAQSEADVVVANVRAVLQGFGLTNVVVDHRDGTVFIGGPVPTKADLDAVATAARAVAGTHPIDTAALVVVPADAVAQEQAVAAPAAPAVGRSEALQGELDRILAATPLIFQSGQATLTDLHQRILNNAVLAIQAYPGLEITIAGYTDVLGDEAANRELSLTRAENVKAYLAGQGIPVESFKVEARGEEAATGSEALAGLERRVELEVTGGGAPPPGLDTIRVAIVAPSASNDLAFTQSMVDAVNVIATERSIEVSVSDNTFIPDEAAAEVRRYAEEGAHLVIAHGSQFGAALLDIAPQFPDTVFAWGTASDTFGLPNVYAYDAAAQEGGYVLGALASLISPNNVVGVVGPIEVGDAAQYVNGFTAGARDEDPTADVRVTYTGSFSDIGLASEAAQAHLDAGADVMTGSAQMVVGAISAAEQRGALWFGTQANQTSLAPSSVVASQVYHWEVALRPIIRDIDAGIRAGTSHTASLANGGLVIEYNPDFPLTPEVRQRGDELVAAIAGGTLTPPG